MCPVTGTNNLRHAPLNSGVVHQNVHKLVLVEGKSVLVVLVSRCKVTSEPAAAVSPTHVNTSSSLLQQVIRTGIPKFKFSQYHPKKSLSFFNVCMTHVNNEHVISA